MGKRVQVQEVVAEGFVDRMARLLKDPALNHEEMAI
jgi:hypothetical protein